MIPKIQSPIDHLYNQYVEIEQKEKQNPLFLKKITTIFDDILNGKIQIQNNDFFKMNQWIDWALQTQNDPHVCVMIRKTCAIFSRFYPSKIAENPKIFSLPLDQVLESLICLLNEHGASSEEIPSKLIQQCITNGRKDLLRLFVYAGFSIENKGEGQNTIAYQAVIERKPEILEFFISQKISIYQSWIKYNTKVDLLFIDMIQPQHDPQITTLLFNEFIKQKKNSPHSYFNEKYIGLMIGLGWLNRLKCPNNKCGEFFLEFVLHNYSQVLNLNRIFLEIFRIFLKSEDPKIIDFLNSIKVLAEKYDKLEEFYTELLEMIVNISSQTNNLTKLKEIKHLLDLEHPATREALIWLERKYDLKNRSIHPIIDEIMPMDEFWSLPRESIKSQNVHWLIRDKAFYGHKGVKWFPPNCASPDLKIGRALFDEVILGHTTETEGSCTYPMDDSQLLSQNYLGFPFYDRYLYKQLMKGYQKADLPLDENVINFFKNSQETDPEQVIRAIYSGEACSVKMSFQSHGMEMFIYNHILVICDTGGFIKDHTFKIYCTSHPKNITVDMLKNLDDHTRKPSSFSLFLNKMLDDLDVKEVFSLGVLREEKHFKMQTKRNCTWQSKLMCFFVYLCMEKLKEVATEEEWKDPTLLSEDTYIVWSSHFDEIGEIVGNAHSQVIQHFLEKKFTALTSYNTILPINVDFLTKVVLNASSYTPQNSLNHQIYARYLEKLWGFDSRDFINVIATSKSRFHSNELPFYPLFLGLHYFILDEFEKSHHENLKNTLIDYRDDILDCIKCCPDDEMHVKIGVENWYSPYELAIILNDNYFLWRETNPSSFSEAVNYLKSAYKVKDKENIFKFLNSTLSFVQKRNINEDPCWNDFMVILLDTQVHLAEKQFKYILFLAHLFAFIENSGRQLLPYFQYHRNFISNHPLSYETFYNAFGYFLKKSAENKRLTLQTLVGRYRSLAIDLLNLYPRLHQIKYAFIRPVDLALLAQDEKLINFFNMKRCNK